MSSSSHHSTPQPHTFSGCWSLWQDSLYLHSVLHHPRMISPPHIPACPPVSGNSRNCVQKKWHLLTFLDTTQTITSPLRASRTPPAQVSHSNPVITIFLWFSLPRCPSVLLCLVMGHISPPCSKLTLVFVIKLVRNPSKVSVFGLCLSAYSCAGLQAPLKISKCNVRVNC